MRSTATSSSRAGPSRSGPSSACWRRLTAATGGDGRRPTGAPIAPRWLVLRASGPTGALPPVAAMAARRAVGGGVGAPRRHARPRRRVRARRRRRMVMAGPAGTGRVHRRATRRVQHPGPGLGAAALRPVEAAGRGVPALRRDHPRQPPTRRRPPRRPRPRSGPPLLGARRLRPHERHPTSGTPSRTSSMSSPGRANGPAPTSSARTWERRRRRSSTPSPPVAFSPTGCCGSRRSRPPSSRTGDGRGHDPRPAHRGRPVDGSGHGDATGARPRAQRGGMGGDPRAAAPVDGRVRRCARRRGDRRCAPVAGRGAVTARVGDARRRPRRRRAAEHAGHHRPVAELVSRPFLSPSKISSVIPSPTASPIS